MEKLLDVVVVNDYAAITGGSTAVAIASATGLAARGHHVTLFTCVGPVSSQLHAVPGLRVVCLGQEEIGRDQSRLRAFSSGLRNRRAEAALRAELAGRDPANTVVHFHTWTKALSPFAIDAALSVGFRVVITLHDFFITCPSGGFFLHRTGELCAKKPLSLDCLRCNCDRRNYGHKVWRSARTVLQNKILKVPERVSRLVGVSEFSLAVMRPHLPAGVPMGVVRNPVDVSKEPMVAAEENREFFFIGRFEKEKGVGLFAEAVRRTGLPATFIGDGALMPEVKKLCPTSRFLGWLSPEEVRAKVREARALVFPPLWYETLGLVAIEAAAAGIPPIVSNRCAATDYIRDGVNGVHFNHASVESLSEQMLKISADDELTRRLSHAAYDWYWDDPWTVDAHVDQLLETYAEVLGLPAAKEACAP